MQIDPVYAVCIGGWAPSRGMRVCVCFIIMQYIESLGSVHNGPMMISKLGLVWFTQR